MSKNQQHPSVGFPPPQGYTPQGYPPPPPPQGYPPPPPQGYPPPPPPQGYPPPPPQGYRPSSPPQGYPPQGYPPPSLPQGYPPPPQGYPPQGYPPQGYPPQYAPHIRMESPTPSQPCQSSANSSEILYTPKVKHDLIPKIGQQFDTLDEVQKFYNDYGRDGGFGTRIASSKKSREGEVIRKEYVCCKEGVRIKKHLPQNFQHKRGQTREGCPAKLCVSKNREGEGFVVKIFVEGHNHPLTTPKRVHLLRSHRGMPDAKRNLSQQLSDTNVSGSQQMSFFEVQSEGLDKVGFSHRDLYNEKRDRRKELEGHDANLLHEYFRNHQKCNPGFTFQFEDDGTGFMSHCFWADATSRKAYQYFGDVVVFDTTYQTNRYDLIFAPILGVNHHGQTCLFGCAFLNHENVGSFEWLLKEWLKAMPAGPPKMIITDQDPAMKQAVATLLPNALHRYCIWHIVSKFSEKIGAISYKQHYDEFCSCIWNSETPEEFESRWLEIVAKDNLSTNQWLDSLYQIRERWVPAYTRHIFSAHMTSSQRAEGAHSFFKKYVSSQNSLLDFVTRFDRALAKIRHNELDFDHKDLDEKPILITKRVMELKMSELYTRNIFYKFQEELLQSGTYVLKSTFKDDHRSVYNVRRETECDSKGREVSLDKSSNYVKCSCLKFECDGIICRHILAYFAKKQITEVPEQYILRRWTKSAKASRVMDDLGATSKEICDTPLALTHNRLFKLASNVVDEVVVDEHESQVFEEYLLSTLKRFAGMKLGSAKGEGSSTQTRISLPTEHHFKEPPKVRFKGCGSGKRLKRGKEKALKKDRRCAACGGTGHDKRNCPKLCNMSSHDVGDDDDDDGEFESEDEFKSDDD